MSRYFFFYTAGGSRDLSAIFVLVVCPKPAQFDPIQTRTRGGTGSPEGHYKGADGLTGGTLGRMRDSDGLNNEDGSLVKYGNISRTEGGAAEQGRPQNAGWAGPHCIYLIERHSIRHIIVFPSLENPAGVHFIAFCPR